VYPFRGVWLIIAIPQRTGLTVSALTQTAPAPQLDPSPFSVAPRGVERHETLPSKPIRPRFVPDEFFGHQPTTRDHLPNPEPLLENLTRCVVEILAGARDLEQIARWVTDDVYRHLLKRVVISTRARQAKNRAASRPAFTIGSTSICEPRDGVVEAVIIVHGRARSRAVALRLEGLDRRWRATAINVL
jgi:Family of unknown function (DUF6459)